MGLGRKGFYFTFIALLLTGIFIVLFSTSSVTPKVTLYSEQAQIVTVNAITKDLQDVFLPRIMVSSSKKAMEAIIKNLSNTEQPLDDPSLRFAELLVDGTLYGNPEPLMENSTLTYWTNEIKRIAEEQFMMQLDVVFYDIQVYQTDPWKVTFASRVGIFADQKDIQFEIEDVVRANHSIEGLQDPLFLLHGSERTVRRAMTQSWNRTEAEKHIIAGSFAHYYGAPSFLMRMANNTHASACCGIESILNSSFGEHNLSYVDYLFWNETFRCGIADPLYGNVFNVSEILSIPGETRVKMDSVHIAYYNLGFGAGNVC